MYAPAFNGTLKRWIVLHTWTGERVGKPGGFDSYEEAKRFADQLNGPFD